MGRFYIDLHEYHTNQQNVGKRTSVMDGTYHPIDDWRPTYDFIRCYICSFMKVCAALGIHTPPEILDPQNIPKKPSQEDFGCIIMIDFCLHCGWGERRGRICVEKNPLPKVRHQSITTTKILQTSREKKQRNIPHRSLRHHVLHLLLLHLLLHQSLPIFCTSS